MITQNYRVISGAYGRDYKSSKNAIADFKANKDFVLQPDGCYCSIRDFAPGVTVEIRYKHMASVVLHKV